MFNTLPTKPLRPPTKPLRRFKPAIASVGKAIAARVIAKPSALLRAADRSRCARSRQILSANRNV